MRITYAPRGILQIDDARIVYPNFSGRSSIYNKEGDRNFLVVIPDEATAHELIDRGWNVRIRPPKEEGDTPFMTLKVKLKFNGYGPNVYLVTNGVQRELDESTVGVLDHINILCVDLDIRPLPWSDGPRSGTSAWLNAIRVTQNIDRFTEQYSESDEF